MNNDFRISILGGGPAGLAAGYYAKKRGIPFTLYEAQDRVGGNCTTLRHGDFLFDSGAHRFHNKDPEITQEIISLMGGDLVKIDVPSQIYHRGKFIDFPLSPLNLLIRLGFLHFMAASLEVIRAKLGNGKKTSKSFEDFALATYGRKIAEAFLLKYSEKLWGAPCAQLSPAISGKRLQGLDLRTFIKESFLGKSAKTAHLDGTFYYPKRGYGMIVERLAESCGLNNIVKGARITRIYHDDSRIVAFEVNSKGRIEVDRMVSTLPLDLFLKMMEPQPPHEIMALAKEIRYRDLILVTLFLDKERVTPNASIYFPDPEFPFTRVYEPKRRSALMSPSGKTSLVAEIPCQEGDPLWNRKDEELKALVQTKYESIGWVEANEVIDFMVVRIRYAYPILELGYEEKISQIMSYLDRFKNLKLSGRSGKFKYTHLHDMMRFGKEVVEEYLTESSRA